MISELYWGMGVLDNPPVGLQIALSTDRQVVFQIELSHYTTTMFIIQV